MVHLKEDYEYVHKNRFANMEIQVIKIAFFFKNNNMATMFDYFLKKVHSIKATSADF